MKNAVSCLGGTDLFPEEKGRVFRGKVHQLSATLRGFNFNPKGNFFSKGSCGGLMPLCLLEKSMLLWACEVAALCSLEPRSKMSQKHPKDFARCFCQGKYGLWNGNSETIHGVPGIIREKKRLCPSQYIQEWSLRGNTHPHLTQTLQIASWLFTVPGMHGLESLTGKLQQKIKVR